MAEARTCPECGAALPADAPEGLCPKCLLVHGLSTAGGEEKSYQGRFVPPEPAELARLFPQLEILELLGRGGMGAVYKARQPQLDRQVALKILPPEAGRDPAFAERFVREARALAKLNHPHIVAVYDFGQVDGLYYFLMEYVDGLNVRQLLREGHLKSEEALKIVPQICEALQFAHDEGIVHRDIKPENVLLDRKGRVKIADFGVAKLLGQAPADYTLTGPWQVMGTPHYMAPEQMERPKEVDHRADIYALGVVFYEMLTGELPIGKFQPPSKKVEVDVRLDDVVLHALESEPARRYQHASEMKTDVESISSGIGSPVIPAQTHVPISLGSIWQQWRQGRAQTTVKLTKGVLLGVFVLSLLSFFSVTGRTKQYPSYIWVGSPSPWLTIDTNGLQIHFLSWSWIFALTATLSLYAFGVIRRAEARPLRDSMGRLLSSLCAYPGRWAVGTFLTLSLAYVLGLLWLLVALGAWPPSPREDFIIGILVGIVVSFVISLVPYVVAVWCRGQGLSEHKTGKEGTEQPYQQAGEVKTDVETISRRAAPAEVGTARRPERDVEDVKIEQFKRRLWSAWAFWWTPNPDWTRQYARQVLLPLLAVACVYAVLAIPLVIFQGRYGWEDWWVSLLVAFGALLFAIAGLRFHLRFANRRSDRKP